MRIIIASPPKTGNIWIKCLLANIYGLEILYKPPKDEFLLKKAFEAGWFEENTTFHQHFSPTPSFFKTTDEIGCAVVTILRNPYDVFVSLFNFIQNFPKQFGRAGSPFEHIIDKAIDHPNTIEFIENGFGDHIRSAVDWLQAEHTILTRYETLHANPLEETQRITNLLAIVETPVVRDAIEACKAGNMRKQFKRYTRHIRKGGVGDWRNYLGAAHLEAMRTHADLIIAAGYEVY